MSVSPARDPRVTTSRLFVGVLAVVYAALTAAFVAYTLTSPATPRWGFAALLAAGALAHAFVWQQLRSATTTQPHTAPTRSRVRM